MIGDLVDQRTVDMSNMKIVMVTKFYRLLRVLPSNQDCTSNLFANEALQAYVYKLTVIDR